MKLKTLFCGKKYSISGEVYNLVAVLSYGSGLLHGVQRYIFEPENKSLPVLRATHWSDGEILRISRY